MNKRNKQADWTELEKREANIKARSKLTSHLSVTALTLVVILSLFQSNFHAFRGLLIDALFRSQLAPNPNPAISIVAYDPTTAAKYQGNRKLPASELIKTVLAINAQHPLAIAVLAPVNEKLYNDLELHQMAEAFSRVSPIFIGYTDNESLGKNPPRSLLHSAQYLPGFVSRDTFSYGADSVSRRVMLSIDGVPSVYAKLATLYQQKGSAPRSYPVNRVEKFGEASQTYINWQGPPGTYPLIPMSELSTTPDDKFTGKIVLVGTALESNKDSDFIFTPFSREPFKTTLLEGAAHGLSTLIKQDGLFKTPTWFDVLLTLFMGIVSVNLILALSPARGLMVLFSELVLLIAVAHIALFQFQCWVNIVHPLITVFISYYLVIPYRLVEEYKKRWHYQEKSEFMAELEQLKTNFLSLVSHDLKTPLAQIQGNAELALNDSAVPVTPGQKKSLETIVQTTEGLTNYVESILDLTRIEGSKVHLNKTSKDINKVIQDVAHSKANLAEAKNISVQLELEPLFSFKFDVKLIQQVISNLLENAIKYSPPETKIILRSKEENSLIQVSVSDEGFGIPSDEQERIFSKFYRMSDSHTRSEKGSGLGLYLVKYFVELHKGFVTLQSQLDKGSTFTVCLPV